MVLDLLDEITADTSAQAGAKHERPMRRADAVPTSWRTPGPAFCCSK